MVDLNDPQVWNIALSILGGAGIAGAGRLLALYTGRWTFSTTDDYIDEYITELDAIGGIGLEIRSEIEKLDSARLEPVRSQRGYKIDMKRAMEFEIRQEAGLKTRESYYRKKSHSDLPNIDYVVCFSNTDCTSGNNAKARVLAASISSEIRRLQKKPEVYAIGSNLVKMETGRSLEILKKQPESGFNLYSSLRALYGDGFENLTYLFLMVDSSAFPTDTKKEEKFVKESQNETNALPVVVELGKLKHFNLRRLSDRLGWTYVNIPVYNYGIAAQYLVETLQEARKNLRGIA